MRRAFVVLVLLAMMYGLKALKAETPGAADPLTLAAIGFVVLAAFAVAELGKLASLPKVTGYIVSGVVLGPYALAVLSQDVVDEMAMFKQLALGLIATTAGLELDLKGLRSLAKTLGVTIAGKLTLGPLLVGGTIIVGQNLFHVLDLPDMDTTIAVALVMAALSLGTSPAIALAIISENASKGRLTDMVLGAAIVKDVVVVVALAVAVAIAGTFVGGGEGIGASLVHTGAEIGSSVVVGSIVGVLLILYLRFVKAEMLLFVAAVVLVVGQISNALHLELLLVFIVAGLIVRNFSKYERDLLHPLETVSLPVFIVFFTTAGAGVDLRATLAVFPLALAVAAARAVGYYFSARIGGKVGGESEPVQKLAWLGYLPQAGVTLGLLALAANKLETLTAPILALGMAVVAINLLVGPITLRIALRSAGEIGDAAPETAEAGAEPEAEGSGADLWADLEAAPLRAVVKEVTDAQQAALQSWVAEHVAPWVAERVAHTAEPIRDIEGREATLTAVNAALDRLPEDDAPARVEVALDIFRAHVNALEEVEVEVTVPLEETWRVRQSGDSWSEILRKRAARVGDALRFRFRDRDRVVPVRAAARTVLEPRLAHALEAGVRDWFRCEAKLLEQLRRMALGVVTGSEAAVEMHAIGSRFVAELEADLMVACSRSARALASELGRVGSPVYPASTVRYSRVEPELVAWHKRLTADAEAWVGRRDAGARLVRVVTDVAQIEQRIDTHLGAQVISVAAEAFAAVAEEIEAQQRRLGQVVEHVQQAPVLDEATRERVAMEIAALVHKPVQKRLRAIGGKLRRVTSGAALGTVERDAAVEQLGRESMVHSLAALIDAPSPARGELVSLDVGETIQAFVAAELEPKLEELLGQTWVAFAAAREAMSNCVSAAEFVLASAVCDSDDMPAPAVVAGQLQEAGEPLAAAAPAATKIWAGLEVQIREVLGGIDEHIVDSIALAGGRAPQKSQKRLSPLVTRVRAIWGRYGVPAVDRAQVLFRRLRGEAEHGIGRHYRLRSGAERADAADIRAYIRDADETSGGELRPVYRALFSNEPVRDPRLFVAHRASLQEVVRVERAWQQDPTTGNGVIVVGGSGMGKSSMTHVARLKLSTRRVIVVPERSRTEESTLLGYIAHELGCEADSTSIATALGRSRSAIVIDDLHEWFELGPAGVASVDALLTLMASTRGDAFWLVSVSTEWLESVAPLIPVSAAFAQVVRLGRVGASRLGEVMDSRQQLSGLAWVYPVGWRARVMERLFQRTARDTFLRRLAAASRGNLRQALRTWLRGAQEDVDARAIEMRGLGVAWGLSFLRQLSATQLGVLTTLLRAGKRHSAELGEALALPADHVDREIRFLIAAGLLEEQSEWLNVPIGVRDDVAAALMEFGALPGGKR